MSLLLGSYILNSLLLVFLGFSFFRKYTNLGGAFFLVFCLSTSAWFIFFILSFFFTESLQVLELFIKLTYFLSIITLYSFLLFLVYFQKRKEKVNGIVFVLFWSFSIALGGLYIYSPAIIDGLYFNTIQQDWYEAEGPLYLLHLILSFLFIPLSIFLSIFRLRELTTIDKKRFQYILGGMILFIALTFIFLLILPVFGIFAMEKYIAFFFFPFILGVFYSTRRYDFLNFKLALGHIFLFVYSLACSFLLLKIFIGYTESHFSKEFKQYWGVNEGSLLVELTVGIIVFMGIYFFLRQKLWSYFWEGGFGKVLDKLKIQIPFITDIKTLNFYLKKEFLNHFNIQHIAIVTDVSNYYENIVFYFETDISRKIFINDIVFLEENKNKFGSYNYAHSKHNAYIIFPLRKIDGSIRAFLEIGKKSLNDPYFTTEINDLESFALFLQGHLKYLSVYKKIQDLSINLDKQVDEKTIEYNNLLSKQKEFIVYVGHEIKNPITNSIFLSDSLCDDIKTVTTWDKKVSKRLNEDSKILYDELIKISKLVKNIFSAEQFDLNKVKLYKKTLYIAEFVQSELRIFENSFPHIYFESDISDVGEREMDETQFRQVLHNLLTNATKFAYKENPKIYVSVKGDTNKKIQIDIEDNGDGFNEININQIFDKYATGDGSSIGLGMGLYLCKKIVELHGGNITAANGEKLGGAKFSITL